jgi:hypothetical protein
VYWLRWLQMDGATPVKTVDPRLGTCLASWSIFKQTPSSSGGGEKRFCGNKTPFVDWPV